MHLVLSLPERSGLPTQCYGTSTEARECAGDGIITIYQRAMAQVWLRLEAIAQQHGVADALQALVRVSHSLSLEQSLLQLGFLNPGDCPSSCRTPLLCPVRTVSIVSLECCHCFPSHPCEQHLHRP